MSYYHWLGRESEEIAGNKLRSMTRKLLDEWSDGIEADGFITVHPKLKPTN